MSREGQVYEAFAAQVPSIFRGPGLLGVFRSVDSTNSLASRISRRLETRRTRPSPIALVAWHQRQGRGRYQRRWVSRPGEAVLASILIRQDDPADLALVPLIAGIALANALRERPGLEVTLKWPNDLCVGGAKLGGILTEAISRGQSSWVIVGLGINHGPRLPNVPGRRTTSLLHEAPGSRSLAEAAVDSIEALLALLARPPSAEEVAEQAGRLAFHRPGDRICLVTPNDSVTGIYVGIDQSGRLVLDTEAGRQSFTAGEVVNA